MANMEDTAMGTAHSSINTVDSVANQNDRGAGTVGKEVGSTSHPNGSSSNDDGHSSSSSTEDDDDEHEFHDEFENIGEEQDQAQAQDVLVETLPNAEPEPQQEPPTSSNESVGVDNKTVTKAHEGDATKPTTTPTTSTTALPTPLVDDDEEDDVLPPVHGEKGVLYTLSELFINPNLRLKSANAVLRKDPFAIPRATDNVTGYRPRFNPLSILVSEEKLLPQNFTFDFSEDIPGAPKNSSTRQRARTRTSSADAIAASGASGASDPSFLVRKVAPIRIPPQTFGDKLSTMGLLMGSLPRRALASPLINTPTVHNPFGDPLMELVATSDPPSTAEPITLQPLRTGAALASLAQPSAQPLVQAPVDEAVVALTDFEIGVDMHSISGLSKLSIVANAAAEAAAAGEASMFSANYSNAYAARMMPPTSPALPAVYDGLMNYLPSHFAEKRLPSGHVGLPMTQYDVAAAAFHPHGHDQQQYQHHHQQQHQMSDETYMDSFEDHYVSNFGGLGGAAPLASEYDQPTTASCSPSAAAAMQSLQPIAKKPRSKNVFRQCSASGCTKGARGKSGLCQKHGGGKRCATANCPKGAQGSSKYCLFHGGGYRCTMPGCTTGARGTSGLCAKHGGYKRAREEDDDHDGHDLYGGGGGGDANGQAAKNPRLEFEGRALDETEG